MRTARSIAVALVASAALLSGCDSSAPKPSATAGSPSPTTSPAPAAKEVLTGAVKDLQSAPYTYTMKLSAGDFAGAVDPATGTKTAKVSRASSPKFTIETVIIGADYYFKVADVPLDGIDPKKWYKLDRAKVTKDVIIGFAESKDPTNTGNFLAAVQTAEQPEPTRITGTLDLTKAGDLGLRDPAGLTALGERAKAAPYVVTLDAAKKVTSITVTIPAYGAVKETQATVAYAGHGTALTVTAPAGAAPAPAAVYAFLG